MQNEHSAFFQVLLEEIKALVEIMCQPYWNWCNRSISSGGDLTANTERTEGNRNQIHDPL